MEIKPKSVFRRGAEDGIWFGLYLSVLFIFTAISIDVPLLGHLATLLALGVPVYAYFTLRKGFVENGCFYTFSEMWTYGIILFLCGSLVMAMTVVVYLSWVSPSFIYDQSQLAISIYRQMGSATGNEIASALEKVVEQGMLPSPISLAGNLISFSVFSGSILSIILSLIIRRFNRKK